MGLQSSTDLTERIRQASDIVDVVSTFVTLRRAGRSLKGLCPFHVEKTPSFHVSPERQTFKCFGCGVGGDVFKFIQLRENIAFLEARAILAERASIPLNEPGSTVPASGAGDKVELERLNRWASQWFRQRLTAPEGQKARRYAADRGFNEESLEHFCIGYAAPGWDSLCKAAQKASIPQAMLLSAGLAKQRPDGTLYDAFRDRLMFPIVDALGRLVGFGGRTLCEDDAKYLNTPQNALFDKGRLLYGLPRAKEAFREHQTAIIVEGYIDCLLAQQFGFHHCVATLGTALTLDHVQILRRYVERAVLVFDSDAAGERAADQALPYFLRTGLEVSLARVREGKDPADLLYSQGAEAFNLVLTSAVGALESKWQRVLRRWQDQSSGTGIREAVEEFLALLAGSPDLGACDPIQRGLVLNQVGKLLGLSGEEVGRQLRIVARRLTPTSGPGPTKSPATARPADARQAALRDLLGVTLNDGAWCATVLSEAAEELAADGALSVIARLVRAQFEEEGEIDVARLLGRVESTDVASQIMELQAVGERRGNFAATVEGALACLRRLRGQRVLAAATEVLRRGDGTMPPAADGAVSALPVTELGLDSASALRALSEAARNTPHFVDRKRSRRTQLGA